MRGVAEQQPLQPFLDIHDIRYADNQVAARFQQPPVFPKRLRRRIDMFQSIQRGDVVKRPRRIRERARQIAALNLDSIQAEQLRVEVAASHIETL